MYDFFYWCRVHTPSNSNSFIGAAALIMCFWYIIHSLCCNNITKQMKFTKKACKHVKLSISSQFVSKNAILQLFLVFLMTKTTHLECYNFNPTCKHFLGWFHTFSRQVDSKLWPVFSDPYSQKQTSFNPRFWMNQAWFFTLIISIENQAFNLGISIMLICILYYKLINNFHLTDSQFNGNWSAIVCSLKVWFQFCLITM